MALRLITHLNVLHGYRAAAAYQGTSTRYKTSTCYKQFCRRRTNTFDVTARMLRPAQLMLRRETSNK